MPKQKRKYEVFDFIDLESHVVRLLRTEVEFELFRLHSNNPYQTIVIVGSSSGINHDPNGFSQRFFILTPATNDEEMQKLYEQAKAEGRVFRQ